MLAKILFILGDLFTFFIFARFSLRSSENFLYVVLLLFTAGVVGSFFKDIFPEIKPIIKKVPYEMLRPFCMIILLVITLMLIFTPVLGYAVLVLFYIALSIDKEKDWRGLLLAIITLLILSLKFL